MLKILAELFGDKLPLTAELWTIALVAVVVVAFFVSLILGLAVGRFKKIKSVMRMTAANPAAAVSAMKKMPAAVRVLYKNARISNTKPSTLVTEQVCVTEPYKSSLISKVWLVTLVATIVCALLAYFVIPVAYVDAKQVTAEDAIYIGKAIFTVPATILILGGLLTIIGGIIGKCSYNGAVKIYEKFIPSVDGDHKASDEQPQQYAEPQQYSEQPQQVYAEPQAEYADAQPVYADAQADYEQPQQVYAEPQDTFAEPQQAYAEPQQVYAEEPQPVVMQQTESEEDIRKHAREEALAQARAEQARAQQAARAQQQQQPQQTAAPSGSSTVDDVIAQIEKIDRDGAPRETMREVATLLQKERNKPENKSPEQQKRLNEALSKLLKAMTAASRK